MGLNTFLTHARKKFFAVLRRQATSTSDIRNEFETLSRYIFSHGHYSRGRVKPAAFMPPAGVVAISMFFIDRLTENEIWTIGDFAGKNRGKAALARSDIQCKSVRELHLTVEPAPEDHPRHVNITGWPAEKDQQKALALEFCANSTLCVRP